jgi:hypothetical protein
MTLCTSRRHCLYIQSSLYVHHIVTIRTSVIIVCTSLPRRGLSMKSPLFFRSSLFVVVLVVYALESPSELSTPTGGLPAPQSSWRGQRRRRHWTIPETSSWRKSWKTKNPKSPKMKNKSIKQTNKRRQIRCPCDRHRDLPRREGARHYLCQQLRANCRAWRFTGPSSSLREAGPSRTRKRRCLREPRDHRHLIKGCSRGEGPGADLRICVSFARWSERP